MAQEVRSCVPVYREEAIIPLLGVVAGLVGTICAFEATKIAWTNILNQNKQ